MQAYHGHFQLHLKCWPSEGLVNYFFPLAIVSREDCCFKYQNQSYKGQCEHSSSCLRDHKGMSIVLSIDLIVLIINYWFPSFEHIVHSHHNTCFTYVHTYIYLAYLPPYIFIVFKLFFPFEIVNLGFLGKIKISVLFFYSFPVPKW